MHCRLIGVDVFFTVQEDGTIAIAIHVQKGSERREKVKVFYTTNLIRAMKY